MQNYKEAFKYSKFKQFYVGMYVKIEIRDKIF